MAEANPAGAIHKQSILQDLSGTGGVGGVGLVCMCGGSAACCAVLLCVLYAWGLARRGAETRLPHLRAASMRRATRLPHLRAASMRRVTRISQLRAAAPTRRATRLSHLRAAAVRRATRLSDLRAASMRRAARLSHLRAAAMGRVARSSRRVVKVAAGIHARCDFEKPDLKSEPLFSSKPLVGVKGEPLFSSKSPTYARDPHPGRLRPRIHSSGRLLI